MSLITKIDSAKKAGLDISACMYTYTAGATGFDASMPTYVQEGGLDKWVGRLKDPVIRKKILKEMVTPTNDWENLFLGAGADNIICTGFKQDSLKYLTGKRRLSRNCQKMRNFPDLLKKPIIDLIIQDHSRVEVIYFLMSEDNVKKEIKLPYMTFGSDEASMAALKAFFLKSPSVAYPSRVHMGHFAKLLGTYVREEKLIPLEEAIHKLSGLAASQLKIKNRGLLKVGNYADVVIFDPATIAAHSTYEQPQQFATGVKDVFINGVQVLKGGEHTGAKSGRAVFGAGKQ